MKFSKRSRLLIYAIILNALVYLLAAGYIIYRNYEYSISIAEEHISKASDVNARVIMDSFNKEIEMTRTIAQSFLEYRNENQPDYLSVYKQIMKSVLINNPKLSGMSLSLELSAIDPEYRREHGRIEIMYFNLGGNVQTKIDTLDLKEEELVSTYHKVKITRKEDISEPYLFKPYENDTELDLISSVSIPMIENDKFLGLLRFDIKLDIYDKLLHEMKPFESAESFILSNGGIFASSSRINLKNRNILDVDAIVTAEHNIVKNIKDSKHFSFTFPDSLNREHYYSYYPLKFGESHESWSLGVMLSYEDVISAARKQLYISIIGLSIGLLIIIIVLWVIGSSLSRHLSKIGSVIQKLAVGDISSKHSIKKVDVGGEISNINIFVNTLIENLENNIKFALEIGQGNLSYDFTQQSDKDVLGSALLNMRKSLKQSASEDQRRKSEDRKQNWSTQGFARFGEIMRESTDNITEFSYNIISNLIKYLDANQGGLFIINDSDEDNVFIELLASYAYNRRKYITKKINLKVGLVGRCVAEKETIYMTDFPKDYLNISSGLGESAPRCLLLVPIVFNAKVFGVIEMASLNEMEDYQVNFVENIGESIGSTISNVKMNAQTAMLLTESKRQSEELIAQEEEMRKNITNLTTIQNDMESKIVDFEAISNALNSVLLIAEFDMKGKLLDVNQNFLDLINKSKLEVVGMFQGTFAIKKEDTNNNLFRDFWSELRKGITKSTIQNIRLNNKEYELYEIYMPIIDKEGTPYKVLNLSIDITNIYGENNKIADWKD